MPIRRRRCCFVQVDDRAIPDFRQLLRGTLDLKRQRTLEFLCPITGLRVPLEPADLVLLAALDGQQYSPEALAAECGVGAERLAVLRAAGVVIGDGADAPDQAWRERELAFERVGWHDLAAVYQGLTRWDGVAGPDAEREHTGTAHRARLQAHVARRGPAPAHFSARDDGLAQVELPLPELSGRLWELLAARRTVRHFDTTVELPLARLNRVLYATFGAIGLRELAPGVTAVKRSSPSGGGLHPTDAYLLVLAVAELQPGLYHYNMEHHRLDLLQPVTTVAGRSLLARFCAGQSYFAEAHAAFLLVARFDRHFWKYGDHKKAYKAVLQDAAHLSQTFYLCAQDDGLAAFYTAAINDDDIGRELGLDPTRAAALGICGLGLGDPRRDDLHFVPHPYRPPR